MRRLLWVLALLIILSACAPAAGPMVPYSTMPSNYRYHQQAFHIKIYWNYLGPEQEPITDLGSFLVSGKTLTIAGYIDNYSSAEVYSIELIIMAYDAKGNSLGSIVGRPRDYIIQPEQTSPFLVKMPMTGKETRLVIKEKYEWRERQRER